MHDRNSQNQNMIQSMVHGKSTGGRNREPCMFELLSDPRFYNSKQTQCTHCQFKDPYQQTNPHSHTVNLQPNNRQSFCQCENCQCQQNLSDRNYEHNCHCHCLRQHQEEVNSISPIAHKKTLRPHQVHPELYMYEEVKLKQEYKEEQSFEKKQKTEPNQPLQKKLNPNDEKDRKIIEQRKKKIKQFNKISRDLPNSAFTTYFGKPAFEAYGRCNSQKLKTHNVMPHRGNNHPQNRQSYMSALIKGQKLQNKTVYIPRKPLDELKQQKCKQDEERIINLPLQKPDLINHIRFAQSEDKPNKKQKLPEKRSTTVKDKNKKKSRSMNMTKSTGIFPEEKKKKNKKGEKLKGFNDGLKYMNIRDNLLELLEKKKVKNSQLAYKVTECYPLKLASKTQNIEIKREDDEHPAGKQYQKGLSAKEVIYENRNTGF